MPKVAKFINIVPHCVSLSNSQHKLSATL